MKLSVAEHGVHDVQHHLHVREAELPWWKKKWRRQAVFVHDTFRRLCWALFAKSCRLEVWISTWAFADLLSGSLDCAELAVGLFYQHRLGRRRGWWYLFPWRWRCSGRNPLFWNRTWDCVPALLLPPLQLAHTYCLVIFFPSKGDARNIRLVWKTLATHALWMLSYKRWLRAADLLSGWKQFTIAHHDTWESLCQWWQVYKVSWVCSAGTTMALVIIFAALAPRICFPRYLSMAGEQMESSRMPMNSSMWWQWRSLKKNLCFTRPCRYLKLVFCRKDKMELTQSSKPQTNQPKWLED